MRFAPDAEQAKALDAAMHRELCASLAYLVEASRGHIRFGEAGLDQLLGALGNGKRVSPITFALYYELVEALTSGQVDVAERIFDRLAGMRPVAEPLRVLALGGDQLGRDSDRIVQMLKEPGALSPSLLPAREPEAERFRPLLREALDLLERALPSLSAEFSALVRQIILVRSDPSSQYQLDGGSHYQLWGALFLNVDVHHDLIGMVEVLAHESAHSLLFGLCLDLPLTDNDPAELYHSPLRADARPMDGIFHASFVSARMHWAMSQILADPHLTPAQYARAREAAACDAKNFWDGHAVMERYAILTLRGKEVMASALDYMRGRGAA